MLNVSKTGSTYRLCLLLPLIIILGVALRFHIQFIQWSFNGDEVDLGLSILAQNLNDLFYPFSNNQSAPPLFLLLEKIISEIAKPYISLKIVTFISSCVSVFLFNRILKRSFKEITQIILLAFFCLNPFIISNSLTLKQYSLDLMMGLFAVNYFVMNKHNVKTFLFFVIFCLVSNIGLLFCTSFLIFRIIKNISARKLGTLLTGRNLKTILPFLLAPIPYLIFYLWFLKQPGAESLKRYMVQYWDGSFMPLDFSIFKWIAIQGKVIYYFFFSTYWFVGLPMLLIFLFSIYFTFKKKHRIFQKSPFTLIVIYTFAAGIHLLLSALKMYPFSDRLFLYMAPGIYLLIGVVIDQLIKKTVVDYNYRPEVIMILLIPISAIALFFTYLPKKSNDVLELIEFVNSTNETIFFTPKAQRTAISWLKFSNYECQDVSRIIQSKSWDTTYSSTPDLIIAVQSKKFGHKIKYTSTEPIIAKLIVQNNIVLCHRVNGYVIYEFK